MQERLNSLLNNSLNKQAYSFGKAIRFKKQQEKIVFSNFIIYKKKKIIEQLL